MPKPKILIIYTGGTIGMIKNPRTGILRAFNFDHLLDNIPEINLLDCKINTVSLKHPIDSSNMSPEYWVQISEIIKTYYERVDGFVVLHGSDTMSYTASALSFMLENLAKPVILTGSQLPIGDLRTDAKENLITSIQIASLQKDNRPNIREVCLYFEYKLYRGNRTTKINAEHFQAFSSLNYPELAESGVYLKVHDEYLLKPNTRKKLKVHTHLENRIVLIKLFPGITPEIFANMCSSPDLKGIILETYGAGNCTSEKWFIDILKITLKKNIPIVNVTQCSGGSVMMGRYETSSKLKKIGIISGKDITTEAALAKLMFLLNRGLTPNKLKLAFEKSLRGEIT